MNKIDCVAMTILLAGSSVSDLYYYRIPNNLIVAGWLAGLVFRICNAGISGLGDGIFCIAAGIILLFPLYIVRGMGAGDIKLLSVVSGMYGLGFWMRTGVVFAVLAAMISIFRMIRKGLLVKRIRYFFHFIFGERAGAYYDAERDGRDMVIPLAPILAIAYYIVYFTE